jgi:ribosomal protein S27AE
MTDFHEFPAETPGYDPPQRLCPRCGYGMEGHRADWQKPVVDRYHCERCLRIEKQAPEVFTWVCDVFDNLKLAIDKLQKDGG